MLERALYESRDLVRVPCMRSTVHVVPGDEVHFFLGAYGVRHLPAEYRDLSSLLVRAGLCPPERAAGFVEQLTQQVLVRIRDEGPLTVSQLARRIPELAARVRHSVGKSYEGSFSIGSRLVPFLCATGLLVRARPRGTWRSTLFEYAALGDWLNQSHTAPATREEAVALLVRRYVGAFGPVTRDDVVWWTGLTRTELGPALTALAADLVQVAIEGFGGEYLMLVEDGERLNAAPPVAGQTCFLPSLDPYIMGYRDRGRFLSSEHHGKVFDRAGNALPTVWVRGRVAGVWGQHKSDGSPVYRLFEAVTPDEREQLEDQRQRLDGFLGGEHMGSRISTPFSRSLTER
jgi:hypothetical protein